MSRALVVDDTQLGRHALSEELKSAGFEVHAFGDAYDAIAAVPSVEPSIAVIDFQLPGIDGIELTERIRSFSDVPIILITAYGSPSLLERSERAGAQVMLDFNRDLARTGELALELVRARAASGALPIAAQPEMLRRRKDVLLRASLEKALLETHGNVSEAARRTGISRGSVRYQIKRLGLWPVGPNPAMPKR